MDQGIGKVPVGHNRVLVEPRKSANGASSG